MYKTREETLVANKHTLKATICWKIPHPHEIMPLHQARHYVIYDPLQEKRKGTKLCKNALLLLVHSTFYCEWNGTKIAGIWASVVELWLSVSATSEWWFWENTLWNFKVNFLFNFPYTPQDPCTFNCHVIIRHWTCRLGIAQRHRGGFLNILRWENTR